MQTLWLTLFLGLFVPHRALLLALPLTASIGTTSNLMLGALSSAPDLLAKAANTATCTAGKAISTAWRSSLAVARTTVAGADFVQVSSLRSYSNCQLGFSQQHTHLGLFTRYSL